MAIAYPGMDEELLKQLKQQQMMSIAMNLLAQSGPQPAGTSNFASRLGRAGMGAMDDMAGLTGQAMQYSFFNRTEDRRQKEREEDMAYRRERAATEDEWRQRQFESDAEYRRRQLEARDPMRQMEFIRSLGPEDRMLYAILNGADPFAMSMLPGMGGPEGDGGAMPGAPQADNANWFERLYTDLIAGRDRNRQREDPGFVGPIPEPNLYDYGAEGIARGAEFAVKDNPFAIPITQSLGMGQDLQKWVMNTFGAEGQEPVAPGNEVDARTSLRRRPPATERQQAPQITKEAIRQELDRARTGQTSLTPQQIRNLIDVYRKLDEDEKIATGLGG